MFKEGAWKFIIINFLIGGTIAVILSTLIVLGLRIFIPAPEYPEYNYTQCGDYNIPSYKSCVEEQQKNYQTEAKEYGGKIFIAANIMGLVILILGILGFTMGIGTNIGAGVIISGAFGILFGYIWGWNGADDKVKFAVGVVVALIVIIGGIFVNRMRERHLQQTPSSNIPPMS